MKIHVIRKMQIVLKFLEIRGTHNVMQSIKDYQAGIDVFISEFIDVQAH